MNLAVRDIRQHLGRFALSCIGVGLLLALVLSYSGIYHGFVHEALAVIDNTGVDLWVVQRDTRGPFAEQSRLPEDVRYRIAITPGVREASPYIFYTIQRQWHGQPQRIAVIGYDLHTGLGGPRQIVEGRGIGQKHYEMVADKKLKLPLGTVLRLGLHDYTVVGLTRGMVGSGGDPAAFFSLADAQEIQFVKDNWAIRNFRDAQGRPTSRRCRLSPLCPTCWSVSLLTTPTCTPSTPSSHASIRKLTRWRLRQRSGAGNISLPIPQRRNPSSCCRAA